MKKREKRQKQLYRIIFSVGIHAEFSEEGRERVAGEIKFIRTDFGENGIDPYRPGDSYIDAIKKDTPPNTVKGLGALYNGKFNGDENRKALLSRPMTLKSIEKFVRNNKHLLYLSVSRCKGIALIDEIVEHQFSERAPRKIDFYSTTNNISLAPSQKEALTQQKDIP